MLGRTPRFHALFIRAHGSTCALTHTHTLSLSLARARSLASSSLPACQFGAARVGRRRQPVFSKPRPEQTDFGARELFRAGIGRSRIKESWLHKRRPKRGNLSRAPLPPWTIWAAGATSTSGHLTCLSVFGQMTDGSKTHFCCLRVPGIDVYTYVILETKSPVYS